MNAALLEEYHSVRRQAGLIDCSSWGLLEIRGADRVTFLHGLLTNDIKGLSAGGGCQAALVTPTAKLLADLVVLADTESHWLIAPRDRVDTVLKTLDHYLIVEDVTLADRRGSHAVLALQGPRTPEILKTLNSGVRQAAYSCTGEPGVLLIVPVEEAPALRTQCGEHGAVPVGWDAVNVLRIEAGIPWFGIDMDESHLLPETGLERIAVSDTKGCYVGQEVIARLNTYGSTSRKLMGLVCEGRDVPGANDPIEKDGETIGAITSACWSPALEHPIALGYIKRPFYAEAGTTVEVVRAGQVLTARLMTLPFPRQTSDSRPQTPAND